MTNLIPRDHALIEDEDFERNVRPLLGPATEVVLLDHVIWKIQRRYE